MTTPPLGLPSLRVEGGRLRARLPGSGDDVAVRLVWARPLTGWGKEVCFLDEDGHEVAMVESLDRLDPASRALAEEELATRYLIAKILRVLRASAFFGNRIVEVETDRGVRAFALKDPHRSVVWPTADRLVISDAIGNRFEIESLEGLDPESRREIAKVL